MARKYTEAIHAKRLIGMLKRKDPCSLCTAGKNFNAKSPIISKFNLFDICDICRTFIGLKTGFDKPCPCRAIGKKRAIKRTYLALEEKGYI